MEIEIMGRQFELLPQKGVLWKEAETLLIGDLHLGKVTHFRKAGIAIPSSIPAGNFTRLDDMVRSTQARRIIFLGDLFHHRYNKEWDRFEDWRSSHDNVEMIMVPGNHDILPRSLFEKNNVTIMDDLREEGFLFTHHPPQSLTGNGFTFCGHIHPVYCLKSQAKQNLRLPCFVVEKGHMVLPSFGLFTGGFEVYREQGRKIFVIADHNVFAVD